VHYAVMFTLATMSFWITKTQGLIYGYYNMISLARYPDAVFKGAVKFVFSWVLPVIVVTNVPARLLMNATNTPWPLALHLVLASVLMVILSRVLWTVALRRYASASS
jgi:ABC-2 type transport system permease protein